MQAISTVLNREEIELGGSRRDHYPLVSVIAFGPRDMERSHKPKKGWAGWQPADITHERRYRSHAELTMERICCRRYDIKDNGDTGGGGIMGAIASTYTL